MGKKSVKPPSAPLLGTAPHLSPRDQRPQLSHDLLRSLLLGKALGGRPGGPPPHTQVSQAPLALGQGCPSLRHCVQGVPARPGMMDPRNPGTPGSPWDPELKGRGLPRKKGRGRNQKKENDDTKRKLTFPAPPTE